MSNQRRLKQSNVTPGMRVVCIDPGEYIEFLKAGKTYTVASLRSDSREDIYLKGVALSFKASRFAAAPEAPGRGDKP